MKPVVAFSLLGIATMLLVALGLNLFCGTSRGPGPEIQTRHIMRQLDLACGQYQLSFGAYPPEDADGGIVALTAALTRPSKDCIFSLDNVGSSGRIEDGWGTPFRYRLEKERPRFRSAGEDGEFGTSDDILEPSTH